MMSRLPTLALFAAAVFAQKPVAAPRADGRSTPLMVYAASGVGDCAPLAVISHGAGGSEIGYRYLAEAMVRSGYTTVVMGHRESGLQALRNHAQGAGLVPGLDALLGDPEAESARLLDAGAALGWADTQCKAPFRVLLGHSMGAETVMLEAGARNRIGILSPPAGQDRFDAYVAMSPEGPGLVFPEQAWSGIHKPVLILTGTRDQALQGGPPARQVPWRELPGDPKRTCQWLAVLDDATHMDFAGNGPDAGRAEPFILRSISAFLQGVRAGTCALPPTEPGVRLQSK